MVFNSGWLLVLFSFCSHSKPSRRLRQGKIGSCRRKASQDSGQGQQAARALDVIWAATSNKTVQTWPIQRVEVKVSLSTFSWLCKNTNSGKRESFLMLLSLTHIALSKFLNVLSNILLTCKWGYTRSCFRGLWWGLTETLHAKSLVPGIICEVH